MDELLIVDCCLYPNNEKIEDSMIEIIQNTWFPYNERPGSSETRNIMSREGKSILPSEILNYLMEQGKEIFWECSLLGNESVKIRIYFMEGSLYNIIVLF